MREVHVMFNALYLIIFPSIARCSWQKQQKIKFIMRHSEWETNFKFTTHRHKLSAIWTSFNSNLLKFMRGCIWSDGDGDISRKQSQIWQKVSSIQLTRRDEM